MVKEDERGVADEPRLNLDLLNCTRLLQGNCIFRGVEDAQTVHWQTTFQLLMSQTVIHCCAQDLKPFDSACPFHCSLEQRPYGPGESESCGLQYFHVCEITLSLENGVFICNSKTRLSK